MSSSDVAVRVRNLSKCFEVYNAPHDRLKQFVFPRLQRFAGKETRQYFKEFWALKDISFEIKKGETVGIIGRNGSGKSTLLQIICGTLTPAIGGIETYGRVAALLELGAGFNPEFTGVENVYLAASLYGLSELEIKKRFDSIADFADIGDHIHQPVKTYSSGMYVRLAFAVIAHVDADILVVDEALAVGDAVFTQKCMRFIRKFKENGTLLFVSHDMGSVLNLCERAVWLHDGKIRKMGQAKDISETYLQYTLGEVYGHDTSLHSIDSSSSMITESSDGRAFDDFNPTLNYDAQIKVQNNLSGASGWSSGGGEVLSVDLQEVNNSLAGKGVLKGGEILSMVITAVAHQAMEHPILGFLVRDKLGQDLFGENTLSLTSQNPKSVQAGESFQAAFTFKLPMLPNGNYSVMASLADGDLYNHIQHHWLHDSLIFQVASSKVRYGLVGVEFKKIEFTKL